jgi:uncharacterized protein (DUF58 family)
MPDESARLLDAETLNRLSALEVTARHIVEGFMSGLHDSPYKGSSVEFAEHREYTPGDDIRRLDWKVYAKSDRFYIKEYEEETTLKAYLVLDTSRSMEFKSDGSSKLDYGIKLAAALAYLIQRQQDQVALVLFDEKVRTFLPPQSNQAHLRTIFRTLAEVDSRDKTDIGVIFHEIAERVRQRSLVVIISDLFDDPDRLIHGINHMAHRGHDVIVFQVLDNAEITFPYDKMTRFEGLEIDEKLLANPKALQEAYLAELTSFQHRIKSACMGARVDFVPLDTSRPMAIPLSSYLAARSKIR